MSPREKYLPKQHARFRHGAMQRAAFFSMT